SGALAGPTCGPDNFDQAPPRQGGWITKIARTVHVIARDDDLLGHLRALLVQPLGKGVCLLVEWRRLTGTDKDADLGRPVKIMPERRPVGDLLVCQRNFLLQERLLQRLEII